MTSKEKKPKKIQEDLKVIVRKLPPTLSSEVFIKSIQAFKETLNHFYFIQGKNKEKSSKYGRAFLTFKKMDDKLNFLKNYKPSFIDDKGNTYLAKVEEALYQVDVSNIKVNQNPKEGTYLESQEYKNFMEKMNGLKSTSVEKKTVPIISEEHKKIDKTPLVLDIEKRFNEKREKEEAKKSKNKGNRDHKFKNDKDRDRDHEKDRGKESDRYNDRDRDRDSHYSNHKNQSKTYILYQKKS